MSRDAPYRSALSRYARQIRLAAIGPEGQAAIARAHAVIVGVGALGSAAAEQLARAGVGRITLIDRDVVELSNLQRQCLFDEADAASGAPKAEAARRRLAAINASVRVEGVIADVTAATLPGLVGEYIDSRGVDSSSVILVDGTDNFETRFLLNDLAVRDGLPYAYAGVVGTAATVLMVVPGTGPCLRCLGEPPAAGSVPTCDTVGVLGPAVQIAASIQVAEVLAVAMSPRGFRPRLTSIELWGGGDAGGPARWQTIDGGALGPRDDCPCCRLRRFDFLESSAVRDTLTMCGRDAVQISPAAAASLNLREVAERLSPVGDVSVNEFLLRISVPRAGFEGGRAELTLFRDARAIIRGTSDPAKARSVYAQLVGI